MTSESNNGICSLCVPLPILVCISIAVIVWLSWQQLFPKIYKGKIVKLTSMSYEVM